MAWKPRARHEPRQSEYRKPEWSKLYNDRKWKKESQAYRKLNPICVECEKHGITRDATGLLGCVDHIIPHRGNLELFWDRSNYQTLCNQCHSEKTARGE